MLRSGSRCGCCHRAADPAPARRLEHPNAGDLGQAVERWRCGGDGDGLAVEEPDQRCRSRVAAFEPAGDGIVGRRRLAEGGAPDGEIRVGVLDPGNHLEAVDRIGVDDVRGSARHQRRVKLELESHRLERVRKRRSELAHVLEPRKALSRPERPTQGRQRLGQVPFDRLVGDRVVEVPERIAGVEESREGRDRHGLVEAASRLAKVGLDACGLEHAFDYRLGVAVETPLAPELLRTRAYVDGAWVDADSGETFPVVNPATGETIAEVPRMGAAETRRAIEAAEAALPAWRALLAKERARILRTFADLMMEHVEDLSRLMTLEQGKPLAESRAEIGYGASFLEWFAEEAKRVYGDTIPQPLPDRRILVLKQPIGVAAGITPWNFPSAMITRKAAPALAAGCTMVMKPAEQTPLSALALAELAERAGLPKGVLSIVTGDADDAPVIGGEMTSSTIVRKLGFTGSTTVGKLLMEQCARTVKKVSLELGGNAPFVVFDDADLDVVMQAFMACKFRNSGQTCISANRILVQKGVFDEVVSRLTDLASGLKVASGLEEGVQVGPLIDRQGFEKVERHVADAVERGAEVLVGGEPHPLGGTFYSPTVMTGVTIDADMSCEETFGPVAGLIPFDSEDEAVRVANDTPYGLAAYFFTRDLASAWRVGEALEAGVVAVNTGFVSTEVAPFGGVKESGIGREGSKYGIDEWLEPKYFTMAAV